MKTYLMLDDDAGSEAPAEPYAEAIEDRAGGRLSIVVRRPGRMAETIAMIKEMAPQGLLLDVALTNAQDQEGNPVGIDGIALAQQVRTLQTRARAGNGSEGLPEFPIIRLSKRDVVREYVNKDSTSDDLFDDFVDKETVIDHAVDAASVVLAFAEDYPRLVAFACQEPDNGDIGSLLGCSPELLIRLDPRTLLGLRRPGVPAHVLSRFVVAKLLQRAGPLVDESLLSVRFGIDRERSDDWSTLLERLAECRYKGIFAGGYKRWWMVVVRDWWEQEIDQDKSFARLSAFERVDLLKEKTCLRNLAAIEANEDSPGSRWWHQCAKSGVAVDPSEGVPLLPVYGSETWHDTEYLCLEEALRDPRNVRLAVSERVRVDATLRRRAGQ